MKTDDMFRIDRRCDKENLKYDSLYRLDIAAYSRGADIKCVGLTKRQDFKWTDQRSLKRKRKSKKLEMRYFNSTQSISKVDSDVDDDVHDQFSNFLSKDDFVSLRKVAAPSKNDAEKNNIGKSKSLENSNLNDIEFSKKTEHFNERLRENPHDIDTWLQFVKIQDNAFLDTTNDTISSTFSSFQTSSKGEKAITEKKLDILDKAITKNPSSVKLIIEYMRYLRKISDSGEVHKKWNDFLFRYPNKGLLWQEYLMFVQSDLSKFSMQNTVSSYWKCIKTLSGIQDGSVKSHLADADCSENLLKIFLQCCFFLLQSGKKHQKAIFSW